MHLYTYIREDTKKIWNVSLKCQAIYNNLSLQLQGKYLTTKKLANLSQYYQLFILLEILVQFQIIVHQQATTEKHKVHKVPE